MRLGNQRFCLLIPYRCGIAPFVCGSGVNLVQSYIAPPLPALPILSKLHISSKRTISTMEFAAYYVEAKRPALQGPICSQQQITSTTPAASPVPAAALASGSSLSGGTADNKSLDPDSISARSALRSQRFSIPERNLALKMSSNTSSVVPGTEVYGDCWKTLHKIFSGLQDCSIQTSV